MKKLISLSAAVLITVMVFGQDTIPPARNNFPDSAKLDTRDSMTTGNKWNKDTSSMRNNNKWPDSSMHKMRDSSTAATGNTNSTNSTKATDSTMSSTSATNSAKDNVPATTTQANKNTQTDSSTNSTSGSSATAGSTTTKPIDRVVMTENQVMVVKNGDSTLLADSIKLQSGAVVQKDGSVRFRNGSTTKLKNGQYIDLNVGEGKKTKKTTTSSKTKSS